jgi:hypothetical protein
MYASESDDAALAVVHYEQYIGTDKETYKALYVSPICPYGRLAWRKESHNC